MTSSDKGGGGKNLKMEVMSFMNAPLCFLLCTYASRYLHKNMEVTIIESITKYFSQSIRLGGSEHDIQNSNSIIMKEIKDFTATSL